MHQVYDFDLVIGLFEKEDYTGFGSARGGERLQAFLQSWVS